MNPLPKAVRDYLAVRRGLGFKLIEHETKLRELTKASRNRVGPNTLPL